MTSCERPSGRESYVGRIVFQTRTLLDGNRPDLSGFRFHSAFRTQLHVITEPQSTDSVMVGGGGEMRLNQTRLLPAQQPIRKANQTWQYAHVGRIKVLFPQYYILFTKKQNITIKVKTSRVLERLPRLLIS